MANHRLCPGCKQGNPNQHVERFTAPSNRTEFSKGSKPKQSSYTYKCPSR